MPTTNPHLFKGRIYQCHRVQDADAANAFMAANPSWGLLDETPEGHCFIARMDDKGVGALNELAKPEGLSELGSKAYDIIRAYLDRHHLDFTRGDKAFYSPAEWQARGEDYERNSELIVVYDGGDIRECFDPHEGWAHCEAMNEKLRDVGLYSEPCACWYAAIYKL